MKRLKKLLNRYWRIFLWGLRITVVCLLIDFGYILGKLPDWTHFADGPIQKSAFMMDYEYRRAVDPKLPPLRWRPVSLDDVSSNIAHAIIVAEDYRFYKHSGIDTEAFKEAWEYNLKNHRIIYGGSTISQQMIKNFLLSPSRNPLRKWHELWLTLSLERNISKDRILEVYLNIAEFGVGLYGVEAASRHYWGESAQSLSLNHAVELAATLSAPKKHNPAARTEYFLKQVEKITRNMGLQAAVD
jgi:monofunctional biosynthetic peptidoglycan transglycosylase